MWKLIFSTATLRGVGFNRERMEGEFAVDLPPSECAWFASEPGRYQYVDGVFSEVSPGILADEKKELDKAAAELAIRQKYDRQLAALGRPYLENEQKSWAVQEAEAMAYLANPAAVVPYITTMATTRGIPLEIMAQKIIENAELFRAESARILGEQQKEIDLLNS